MFGKNKNKKVGLCVMVVTASLVLAGLWAVLATPETALADHKPGHDKPGGGGGGGGKDTVTTCVLFDDGGDDIRSDDGMPYCHSKKDKITVKFSDALSFEGHLILNTNSTDRAFASRGLFIDFGTDVTLAPGTINEMTINTTDQALADPRVLGISANLSVGAHQDEFNFFDFVEEVPNDKVNLRILVWFYFKEGSGDKRESLLIQLNPNGGTSSRTCSTSDSVTVTSIDDGSSSGVRQWRVDTLETAVKGACISSGGGDSLNVNTPGLEIPADHIALSFGFTVTTAAP